MHTIVRRWGFFVTRFYTVWPVCCNDWLKEHLGNNLGVYTDQQWKPSGVHTPVYQCFSVRDIPMGSAKRWETICGDPRRKRAREQGFRRVEEKKKRENHVRALLGAEPYDLHGPCFFAGPTQWVHPAGLPWLRAGAVGVVETPSLALYRGNISYRVE